MSKPASSSAVSSPDSEEDVKAPVKMNGKQPEENSPTTVPTSEEAEMDVEDDSVSSSSDEDSSDEEEDSDDDEEAENEKGAPTASAKKGSTRKVTIVEGSKERDIGEEKKDDVGKDLTVPAIDGNVAGEEGEKEEKEKERIVVATEKTTTQLVFGWVKKQIDNREEIAAWAKESIHDAVDSYRQAQELREYKQKYKVFLKEDEELQELHEQCKKLKKQLKAQRLHGDRIKTRNEFKREKEQKQLDRMTARLKKQIWTFAHSSMNVHEYAKAMMRASARMKKRGLRFKGTDKVLAMEAAVLRNMHRMMSVQKQYSLARKEGKEISSFMKRCKTWLDNKYADGLLHMTTLNSTAQAMRIMYEETLQIQEELIPKFEDPENNEFKEPKKKDYSEKLPPGMKRLPKIPKSGPIFISLNGDEKPPEQPQQTALGTKQKSLRKEFENRRSISNLNQKALAAAWDATMKQYENMLVVGGENMQLFDDISDLGDSDEEIEDRMLELNNVRTQDEVNKAAGKAGTVEKKDESKAGHDGEKTETKHEETAKKDKKLTEENDAAAEEKKSAASVDEGKESSATNSAADKEGEKVEGGSKGEVEEEDEEKEEGSVDEEDVKKKHETLDDLLAEKNDSSDDESENDNASVEAELDKALQESMAETGITKTSDESNKEESTVGGGTLDSSAPLDEKDAEDDDDGDDKKEAEATDEEKKA